MNLNTISRLPAEAFAPLGKSRRKQAEEAAAAQPKPAHQPTPITAPPGYRVTPQGGLQRDDQAPLIPEVKGRLLKADDSATCGVVPSQEHKAHLLRFWFPTAALKQEKAPRHEPLDVWSWS